MSTPLRILAFGVVSGLIWSTVPGILAELFRSPVETATVIVSAVLTSFALTAALVRLGKRAAIIFGALSLPLGAFVFGVLLSVVQWAVLDRNLTPISAGLQYAVLSVISIFAIVLFPLAVLTTFLLRAVIVSSAAVLFGLHSEGIET